MSSWRRLGLALACAPALLGCGSTARPAGARTSVHVVRAVTDLDRTGEARADPSGARRCALRPVVAGRTRLASGAIALDAGFGSLWVLGFGSISRLDPGTGRVVARIRAPGAGDNGEIATGGGDLWVTATGTGAVYRIDPRRDRITATVRVGGSVLGIAYGAGRLWATDARRGPGELIAIDPRTDRAAGPPIQVGPGPAQVVYAAHAVYVQDTSPAAVVRVDPRTRRATTVIGTAPVAPASPGPGAIAVSHGSLWSAADGSLARADPVSGQTRSSVPLPRGVAVAFGDARGWVLSYPRSSSPAVFDPIAGTGALWQVDPGTGRVVGPPVRLRGSQPIALAAGGHMLWVADFAGSTVTAFRLTACPAGRRAALLPGRFVDRNLGVAIDYPAGWATHRRALTRLSSPRQLLVVSSFVIRQRRPDPNCTPATALAQLPATGTLLLLLEQEPTGIGSGAGGLFGRRPDRFQLERLGAQPRECFGSARQLTFRTAGRDVYLLAYFGPRAGRRAELLADRTLDSLRLARRGG